MFAPVARIANRLPKNVMTTTVRNHGSHGGVPGENLPFDINNRYKLTVWFTAFLGSGLAAPYLIVRHQLLKKALRMQVAPYSGGKYESPEDL